MTTQTSNAAWEPTQYQRYAEHRARPMQDLLARVTTAEPRLVVDLGCGPGDQTRALAERWPQARIIGLDNSREMIARARQDDVDGRVEWVLQGAEDWDPATMGGPLDVLVSNATLQWVPTHLRLIGRWVEALAPGGTFAMQVPSNFHAPSHRLMREVAQRHTRASELKSALDRADAVAQPETYAALLLDHTPDVDVWETTYQHVLPAADGRPHPVLEWVRATGLRPVLGVLPEGPDRDAFIEAYAAQLETAYPRRAHGVLFPFSRIFAVARSARRE